MTDLPSPEGERSQGASGSGVASADGPVDTPRHRWWQRPWVIPLGVGIVLSLLVCTPLLHGGYVLMLDWVPGPQATQLPRTAWGLDGGVTASLPFVLLLRLGTDIFGSQPMSWLPIALLFPIGVVGVSRLVGGNVAGRVGGGTAYVLTPIMFERLWAGHIGYLVGYALLPFAAAALIAAPERSGIRRFTPVLWITFLAGMSVHYLWICGLILLASMVCRRPTVRHCIWTAATVVLVALCNLYLVPGNASGQAPFAVGGSDVSAYRTLAHGHLGLYGTLATLYGFWRSDPKLPIDENPTWPLFYATLLLIVGAGIVHLVRHRHNRRSLAILAMAAVFGFFLAAGDQGLTSGVYTFLFDHVPGFDVMREPQKFICLLALFYAWAFGLGIATLWDQAVRAPGRILAVVAAVLVPALLVPTLFWGLNGRIRPHPYPASWTIADTMMSHGQGALLFLPWHQYMDLRFADGRRIATPAGSFFHRPVISGDNVELPGLPTSSTSPRSGYLQYLFDNGGHLTTFGDLVAPLGVQYIALDRDADWTSYQWLNNQVDLKKVVSTPDLQLFENLSYKGVAYRLGTPTITVPDWNALVTRVSTTGEDPAAFAVTTRGGAALTGRLGPPAMSSTNQAVAGVRRSPAHYVVPPGAAGGVNVAEPYDLAWRYQGRSGTMTGPGSISFETGIKKALIDYKEWPRHRALYGISSAVWLVIAVYALWENTSRYRQWWRSKRLDASTETRKTASAFVK